MDEPRSDVDRSAVDQVAAGIDPVLIRAILLIQDKSEDKADPARERLVGELVERARAAVTEQGRLRRLLQANQELLGDGGLRQVLHRVVTAARELSAARYAALGVLAAGGATLAEFIPVGAPPGTAAAVGHPPEGKGLLGALITDPRPLRLADRAHDPRSCPLPVGHPPMRSFLGVPIHIGMEVYGNLYLAESEHGEFSADDEALVSTLATTAGFLIDFARRYDAVLSQETWLRAAMALTRRVLAADTDDPVQVIAHRSRGIARADAVAVILIGDDGMELAVDAVSGQARLPEAEREPDPVVRSVFNTGEPRLLTHTQAPTELVRTLGRTDLDTGLVVPLHGAERTHGVLVVARLTGRSPYTATDLATAAEFAQYAAVALEMAVTRTDREQAALAAHDRTAAQLHEHVVRRLFAAGLSLHSTADMAGPGAVGDRIRATIRDLDSTINQIRATVHGLNQLRAGTERDLRSRITAVVEQHSPEFDREPGTTVIGCGREPLPAEVVDDVAAVLHTVLSRASRAASASNVHIAARTNRRELELTVDIDHALDIGADAEADLRRRAESYGGTAIVEATSATGHRTRIRWTVPNS